MKESFDPNKTQSVDSSNKLEVKFKRGDVIRTADGIRTIIVDHMDDKSMYSVRVLHKDGSGKEYLVTGKEILLAGEDPSIITKQWKPIRNTPIEENLRDNMEEAA